MAAVWRPRALTPNQSRVVRDSGSTAAASVLGQGPALLVAPLAALMFGANHSSDAVFLALAIAGFVTTTVAGAANFTAVPFLVSAAAREDGGAAFLVQLTQLTVGASVLLAAGAAVIGSAYLSSYAGIALYLWLLVPFNVLAGVSGLLAGTLNARHDYWSAAISPLFRWLTVLASIVLLGRALGAASLLLGYTLGEGLRLLLLTRQVRAHFARVQGAPAAGSVSTELRHFLRSAAAQVAASGVLALVPIVDRSMARRLPAGAISLLEYADRIWQVPVGFAMSGLLVVVLSKWSHDLHGGSARPNVVDQTRRTATFVALVAIVPCAIVIWFRQPIGALLFAHGRFPLTEVPKVADTLGAYVLGIPTYLAGLTYTRAFLAQKRSGWLLVVAVTEFVLKLLLNGPLLAAYGLPGLALATSTMYAFGLVILIAGFHRRGYR